MRLIQFSKVKGRGKDGILGQCTQRASDGGCCKPQNIMSNVQKGKESHSTRNSKVEEADRQGVHGGLLQRELECRSQEVIEMFGNAMPADVAPMG
jgi:hypothetical protein